MIFVDEENAHLPITIKSMNKMKCIIIFLRKHETREKKSMELEHNV